MTDAEGAPQSSSPVANALRWILVTPCGIATVAVVHLISAWLCGLVVQHILTLHSLSWWKAAILYTVVGPPAALSVLVLVVLGTFLGCMVSVSFIAPSMRGGVLLLAVGYLVYGAWNMSVIMDKTYDPHWKATVAVTAQIVFAVVMAVSLVVLWNTEKGRDG